MCVRLIQGICCFSLLASVTRTSKASKVQGFQDQYERLRPWLTHSLTHVLNLYQWLIGVLHQKQTLVSEMHTCVKVCPHHVKPFHLAVRLSHSLTHSLTHSLPRALTHSLTHSLTRSHSEVPCGQHQRRRPRVAAPRGGSGAFLERS